MEEGSLIAYYPPVIKKVSQEYCTPASVNPDLQQVPPETFRVLKLIEFLEEKNVHRCEPAGDRMGLFHVLVDSQPPRVLVQYVQAGMRVGHGSTVLKPCNIVHLLRSQGHGSA